MEHDLEVQLQELEKKNLCRIDVYGAGTEATFTVHKQVPYKIAQNLGDQNKNVSVFLDHTAAERGQCVLFKRTALIIKKVLTDEAFDKLKKEEEKEVSRYQNWEAPKPSKKRR